VTPQRSRDEWKDKLEAIANARGFPEEQVRAVTRRKVTYSEIVESAGSAVGRPDLTGQVILFFWMAASGIAHARPWAVLSGVLDRLATPGGMENTTALKLTASDKALVVFAGVTALTVNKGWQLLDERCRSSR
jgi:hypothetical protein